MEFIFHFFHFDVYRVQEQDAFILEDENLIHHHYHLIFNFLKWILNDFYTHFHQIDVLTLTKQQF